MGFLVSSLESLIRVIPERIWPLKWKIRLFQQTARGDQEHWPALLRSSKCPVHGPPVGRGDGGAYPRRHGHFCATAACGLWVLRCIHDCV